ncbi:hypothetical protein [Leptospira sp. GIMC2001]|uniref:hypothetical protein n=1 Tax=Leptospira sp. GIMC2001 TaxID=1513297 RepID=UPI002349308B|nr:hypothetical protein [Leptospira sp. GIMC2001]WCL48050.1 hypothetical protein O4O04_12055 [Leptospira sp. GIMC2001]
MKKSIIWNISTGEKFPLELWKHPKIKIELNNVILNDTPNLVLSDDESNILYLRVTKKEWDKVKDQIFKNFALHPFVSIILISSPDDPDAIYADTLGQSKFLVLENPLHLRELRIILDRIIQVEFYKQAAMEIGNGCLANVGFFEGVFELAHKEYESTKQENDALQSILTYEEKIKKNQHDIDIAMQIVNELKNLELIELHDRIKATEKLEELREKELKTVIEAKKATEKALEYSRIEEINLDRIIKAQDRLFAYTDKEIRDLLDENLELKKKLGIKS